MTTHDLVALRDFALALAREAGELLANRPAALDVDSKTSPTDVVTQMDRASETLLVQRIRESRPGDGILGEEGSDSAGCTGVRWIVDPLDGTVNYLYDLPAWCVSIAVEIDGEIEVGVVHSPTQRETFSAIRGEGATLIDERGERRLTAPTAPALDRALVATGFGYSVERRRAQVASLTTVLPRVRDIRRIGSAALDLCALATGRVDAYYERGVQRWDHAAGGLVAREAGASSVEIPWDGDGDILLVAAVEPLFGDLVTLLREAGADRDH